MGVLGVATFRLGVWLVSLVAFSSEGFGFRVEGV